MVHPLGIFLCNSIRSSVTWSAMSTSTIYYFSEVFSFSLSFWTPSVQINNNQSTLLSLYAKFSHIFQVLGSLDPSGIPLYWDVFPGHHQWKFCASILFAHCSVSLILKFYCLFSQTIVSTTRISLGALRSRCQDRIINLGIYFGKMHVREGVRGNGGWSHEIIVQVWPLWGKEKNCIGEVSDYSLLLREFWPDPWWGLKESHLS